MPLITSIYGKGGIGKSTTTSNLAAAFSRRGKSVLQIGCDPKHDSTFPITHHLIPTVTEVLDKYNFNYDSITPEEIIHYGYAGIAAVEAGGPVAGVGCAVDVRHVPLPALQRWPARERSGVATGTHAPLRALRGGHGAHWTRPRL